MHYPLIQNNVNHSDFVAMSEWLLTEPRLTQGPQVEAFEHEWSEWLGVKHSIFVNSGSSANLITLAALKRVYDGGEVLVPAITWSSDVMSVLHNLFEPVFVDVDLNTLSMNTDEAIKAISGLTIAVFLTHAQGFNGLSLKLIEELKPKGIQLIEDVCESTGATFGGKKLGTFGHASNFSFYYAHHMTTIEGGMVCTDDDSLCEVLRMLRSHGLARELSDSKLKEAISLKHQDLSLEFTFMLPSYNVRNNEIGAFLGRRQLKRLDANIEKRNINLAHFLSHLDSTKYYVDFATSGCSNYALPLIMREPNDKFRDELERVMTYHNVEFRRGSSGGGNQMRQPYLEEYYGEVDWTKFINAEHLHFYGYYIGNYPDLSHESILELCKLLSEVEI